MNDDYDLRSHAVYEASAGTGKTHQIEQLVLRLLTETGTTIEQILLVTYTDKAAAELKDRLRKALTTATAAEKGSTRERLLHAQENFDRAQVSTIHSFCLRVLQQFPFDHGQSARAQMTRDQDVLQTCLKHVQRTVWPQKYGGELATLLEVSGYADARHGGSAWDSSVSAVAAGFRPACGHQLRPLAQVDCAALLQSAAAPFAKQIASLRAAVGPLQPLENNPLLRAFDAHPATRKDSHKKVRRDLLKPLLSWLARGETVDNPVGSFGLFAQSLADEPARLTAVLKPPLKGACAALPEIVAAIEQMHGELAALQYKLAADTVQDVLQQMQQHKQERGLQSFDDFLTRVARALDAKHNPRAPELLAALRKTFRYAIVDEFQDTDPVQWNIFRIIFVDARDNEHFLIVVGDPKQAIYAFRNADVQAYVSARKELEALSGAKSRPLTTNYRTCPELIGALNRIFERGNLFGGDIGYAPVMPAAPPLTPEIVSDQTGRKALSLLRVDGERRPVKVAQRVAGFIGAEIDRLLRGAGGAPALSFKRRDKSRVLTADDIAVLFFRRSDALPVEDELRRRGIAFSFYKKSGIWQSAEAEHLLHVLLALVRPDDPAAFRKMLLTRFFSIAPDKIAAFDDAGPAQPLRQLYLHWQELAERRNWAELFRSILEDTGALWQEGGEFDGSRRLANHRYILHTLARDAYARGLALLDIVELLLEKRRTSGEDETGLQPLDTERPAVKLMTIHACKGLEFPVVFLTGGYSQSKHNAAFCKYHDGDNLVFDLEQDDDARQRAQLEDNAERCRLLYVAMTRAMLKLYVPQVSGQYLKGVLPTLLTPALDAAKPEESADTCGVIAVPPQAPAAEPPVLAPQPAAAADIIALPKILWPEIQPGALLHRRIETRSFTGIVAHGSDTQYSEFLRRADDADRHDSAPDALPSGASTGDMLHGILEHLDFAAVLRAPQPQDLLSAGSPARNLIEAQLRRHLPQVLLGGAETAAKVTARTAELLWRTLHAPLAQLKGSQLGALPDTDRLHEVEFEIPFGLGGDAEIGEEITQRPDGYLTGCMDLLFRFERKYYLLDWKSNTLSDYGPAALQADMDARQYTLQYRIYIQALLNWLKRRDKRFNSQRDFGGVFYIYLRGMAPERLGAGVFFHQPEAREWRAADLRREVRAHLHRRRML